MDQSQMAVLGQHLPLGRAGSALPDAPIVPARPARWSRSREFAAGLLHRIADALAPKPAAGGLAWRAERGAG